MSNYETKSKLFYKLYFILTISFIIYYLLFIFIFNLKINTDKYLTKCNQ
jgi:hypothetical protein